MKNKIDIDFTFIKTEIPNYNEMAVYSFNEFVKKYKDITGKKVDEPMAVFYLNGFRDALEIALIEKLKETNEIFFGETK